MQLQDMSVSQKESTQVKLGRKGDPRMHRAVAARLRDPDISLLQALREGGFDFPADGGHDMYCLDADGVTLGQRKNQLSRRVRLARQSADDGGKQFATALPKSVEDSSQVSVMLQGQNYDEASGTRPCKRDASALNEQEEDVDMADEMANIDRMAKYHPQFQAVCVARLLPLYCCLHLCYCLT